MNHSITGVLTAAALFICLVVSASNTNEIIDFTLSINTSEPIDFKVTVISEDEVDFITRTLTNDIAETALQIRPNVKYSLLLRTEGFVPRVEEFIINGTSSSQNFIHLDIQHLKDNSGKIIGEQTIIIFPNDGAYSEHELGSYTANILERVGQVNNSISLTSYSETKFYMTADEYRKKLKEQGDGIAQFDENSIAKYLMTGKEDLWANDSYEELIPSKESRLIAIGNVKTKKHISKTKENPTRGVESTTLASGKIKSAEISEEKLFFTVQLGSFSKQVNSPEKVFKTNSVIAQANEAGGFKYYSGVFYSYKEACAHKESLMDKGAVGLFVAAFNKGKRIPLDSALSAAKEIEKAE